MDIQMGWNNKWASFIKWFVIGILIFALGCFCGYKLSPVKEKLVTKVETKYVEVEGKTKTEVRYVQKTDKSDADVEVKNTNPKVKINDKTFTFEKLPDEKVKFENGKVQVEQGYEIKIDAKSLIPKQPKWGVDIGYSNHGLVTGIRYNFNRNISISGFGTPKPLEKRDKFYGGGLTINF